MNSRKATIISYAVVIAIVVGVFLFLSRPNSDVEEHGELHNDYADDYYVSEYDELHVLDVGALEFTEMSLRETNARMLGLDGDFITTQTEYVLYLFSPDTTSIRKTELILQAETILSTAQDVYNMQFLNRAGRNRIYFTTEESATRINPHNGIFADVVVSIADSDRIGVLFSFISSGNLPAWLCVGLELYWLDVHELSILETDHETDVAAWNEQRINMGLPDFGDAWFVPGLIEDDLSDDVLWIAYEFVNYLSETEQLAELIALYMSDETVWDAENKFAETWSIFSGRPIRENDEKLLLRYLYNRLLDNDRLNVRAAESNNIALFNVFNNYASHYFMYADWWTLERAFEYVSEVANAIDFTLNWLNVDSDILDDTFTVMFHTEQNLFGHRWTTDFDNMTFGIDVYDEHGFFAYLPMIVSSVVVHMHSEHYAYAIFGFDPTSIPSPHSGDFDFALPTLLMHLFIDEIEDPELGRQNLDGGMETLRIWPEHSDRDYVEMYRERAVSADRLDMRAFMDILAIITFDEFAYHNPDLMQESQYMTLEAIRSYGGQRLRGMDIFDASFFWFLLDNGTREDFLRVYADRELMEEVYGSDIDEMTRAWLVHLFGDG